MNALTIAITLVDDLGDEQEHKLPARYEVCQRCDGKGSHVNPAVDGHGISPEEFESDPDFEEAYFGGQYDITCRECDGLRVVLVVDETSLKEPQKAIYLQHLEHEQAMAEYDREDAFTRRAEGGWLE